MSKTVSQNLSFVFFAAQPLLLVLFIGTFGTLAIAGVFHALNTPFKVSVLFQFAGTVISIYVLNRFADFKEDFANDTGRILFFSQRKGFLIASILLGAVVLVTAHPRTVHIFYLLLATGVLYSIPMVPWFARGKKVVYIRLKQIPFAKNIIVALLWGGSIFLIPFSLASESSITYSLFVLLGATIVSSFTNTLFCDVRDMNGDEHSGIKTLPLIFGAKACYRILFIVNIVWLGVYSTLFLSKTIGPGVFALLLVLSALPVAYITLFEKSQLPRQIQDFFIESDLLIISAGLFLL